MGRSLLRIGAAVGLLKHIAKMTRFRQSWLEENPVSEGIAVVVGL